MNKEKNQPKSKQLPVVKEGVVIEKEKHKGLSWWQKRKLKKKPETSWLVEMFFSNGTCREFVIQTKEETFDFMKRTYHLRYEDCWFDLTQNQAKLIFHDDFVEPISRTIHKDGNKNFWKVTPENIKPVIKMNYIKALATSEELDKYLRMTATMIFVLLAISFWIVYTVLKIKKAVILT